MVLHIILADILLIARIFPRPSGARKNTTQLAKYPRVLYVKPSNKIYLFHYKKILLFWLLCFGNSFEIHPALSVHRYMARTNDVNNSESQLNVFNLIG